MLTSKMYLSAVPIVDVKYLNKLFGNISVTLYSIAAMVVLDKARWGGGNGVLLCTLLNTPHYLYLFFDKGIKYKGHLCSKQMTTS